MRRQPTSGPLRARGRTLARVDREDDPHAQGGRRARRASRPRRSSAGRETGVIPEHERHGRDWTAGGGRARADRRPPARARAHASSRSARPASEGRLAYGFIEELFPDEREHAHARGGRRGDRPRAGADRALLDQHRAAARQALEHLTDEDVQALQYVASVLAAGFPLVAFLQLCARVRPGAVADRRRRGAPVPPLRARAADARGRARPRDGRGDGAPGARPAAARLAAHGLRPPALPPALRRAGRGRATWRWSWRTSIGPRPRARGDRLRRPGRLHALHRGGGRGGGAVVRRALRRGA